MIAKRFVALAGRTRIVPGSLAPFQFTSRVSPVSALSFQRRVSHVNTSAVSTTIGRAGSGPVRQFSIFTSMRNSFTPQSKGSKELDSYEQAVNKLGEACAEEGIENIGAFKEFSRAVSKSLHDRYNSCLTHPAISEVFRRPKECQAIADSLPQAQKAIVLEQIKNADMVIQKATEDSLDTIRTVINHPNKKIAMMFHGNLDENVVEAAQKFYELHMKILETIVEDLLNEYEAMSDSLLSVIELTEKDEEHAALYKECTNIMNDVHVACVAEDQSKIDKAMLRLEDHLYVCNHKNAGRQL